MSEEISSIPAETLYGQAGTLRATQQLIAQARAGLGRVIAGQNEVIEQVIMAVLCQGHALLEGVPGIAKTLTVKTLGKLLGLGFQRVQATPDLMPADILGTTILKPGTDTFVFHQGAVFTDLLLVDEINRMPPRTQAALLECMEERQVTADGVRHALPGWFTVFATQNPVDFEGTYPLPEAQLDRFLLKIRVSYPTEAEELQILQRHHASGGAGLLEEAEIAPISEGLLAAARLERRRFARLLDRRLVGTGCGRDFAGPIAGRCHRQGRDCCLGDGADAARCACRGSH